MSAHIPLPRLPATYAAGSELLATIEQIHWQGDGGEAVIFTAHDGSKVVAEGAAGRVEEGETYRFLGEWREDPKYGRQFKAAAFVEHTGHDFQGVAKYLANLRVGIGAAHAKTLWEAYGEYCVRGLREEPQVTVDDGVLSRDVAFAASEALAKAARYEATTIDLHSLFLGRGLGNAAIESCLLRWNVAASSHVRKNPFHLLLAGIPRAGFATVDRLFLDLGGNPAALKRQALAGWNAIREGHNGHTWHPYQAFAKGVIERCGVSVANLPKACALAQRARLIEDGVKFGKAGWIADPGQARNERTVAESVKRLFTGRDPIWQPVEPPAVTPHQANAIRQALGHPIFLLTGIPGTGKTYVAAKILQGVATVYGQGCIAVAAPTGKAAVRITESLLKNGLNLEATTIHRLLHVQRNGRDGGGWGFEFDRDNPLPYRVVAVDEWSMCDTDLASALLSALAPETCLMLIGDPHQLPPVGHGAPLRDMIAAGLPRGHLTEIKRNSGAVTEACKAIVEHRRVEFVDKIDTGAGRNLRLIECKDDAQQLGAMKNIIDHLRNKPNFVLTEDVQIITPRNKDSKVGRIALNQFLSQLLNPIQQTDVAGKVEAFRLRDRVICLSNTILDRYRFVPGMAIHLTESWEKADGTLTNPGQVFVANGDQGRIIAVSKTKPEVLVRFAQPDRYVKWRLAGKKNDDVAQSGGGKEDLALAWAITGHKSQGSEWPVVLAMIDPAGDQVASKEWWYTVLSRTTSFVILLGSRKVFDRQVKRAELPLRKTFLKELLVELDGNEPAATVG